MLVGFFVPYVFSPTANTYPPEFNTVLCPSKIKKRSKKQKRVLMGLFKKFLKIESVKKKEIATVEIVEDEIFVKWFLCAIKQLSNSVWVSSLLFLLELSGVCDQPEITIDRFSIFCECLNNDYDFENSKDLGIALKAIRSLAATGRFTDEWPQKVKTLFSFRELIITEAITRIVPQIQLRQRLFSTQKNEIKLKQLQLIANELSNYIKGTRDHCKILYKWIEESIKSLPADSPEYSSGDTKTESDIFYPATLYPALEKTLSEKIELGVDKLTEGLERLFPGINLASDLTDHKAPMWTVEYLREYLDYCELPLASTKFDSHFFGQEIEVPSALRGRSSMLENPSAFFSPQASSYGHFSD